MPFVFLDVDSLEGNRKVGGGDCVDLIKKYVPQLANVHTSRWRAGAHVVDVKTLPRGTAIATFVNGRYPGLKTGNHAAFYLVTAGAGFYAMDQWIKKPVIAEHRISPSRMTRDGQLVSGLSDAAQAFFVIEL